MSMLHFDYKIKDSPSDGDGGKYPSLLRILSSEANALGVLMTLCAYANRRGRCWPSMNTVAEHVTKNNRNRAGKARQWLERHQALVVVPPDKRIGTEPRSKNKHVYQLTGYFVSDQGVVYSYVHMNDNDWDEIEAALVDLNVKSIEEIQVELAAKSEWMEKQKDTPRYQATVAKKNKAISDRLAEYRNKQEELYENEDDIEDDKNYISTIDEDLHHSVSNVDTVSTSDTHSVSTSVPNSVSNVDTRRYNNKIDTNKKTSSGNNAIDDDVPDAVSLSNDSEVNTKKTLGLDFNNKVRDKKRPSKKDYSTQSDLNNGSAPELSATARNYRNEADNSRLMAESAVLSQDDIPLYENVSKKQQLDDMLIAISEVWSTIKFAPKVKENIAKMLLKTIPKNQGLWHSNQLSLPSNPNEIYGFQNWWNRYKTEGYGGSKPLPVKAEDISVAFSEYRSWSERWLQKRKPKHRQLQNVEDMYDDEYSDWEFN